MPTLSHIPIMLDTTHVARIQTSKIPTRVAFLYEQQNLQHRAETLLLISWENEPASVLNNLLRLICMTSSSFPEPLGLIHGTRL
jgi:hypothetical protein